MSPDATRSAISGESLGLETGHASVGLGAKFSCLGEGNGRLDPVAGYVKVGGEFNVVGAKQVDEGVDATWRRRAQACGKAVAVVHWGSAMRRQPAIAVPRRNSEDMNASSCE